MERLRQKYGKRITVKLPFQPPFVILSDPAEIKELLRRNQQPTHDALPHAQAETPAASAGR